MTAIIISIGTFRAAAPPSNVVPFPRRDPLPTAGAWGKLVDERGYQLAHGWVDAVCPPSTIVLRTVRGELVIGEAADFVPDDEAA